MLGQTSWGRRAAGILGVDVSEQMLERARRRAVGSVEFVLADAPDPRVRGDASFDAGRSAAAA